MSYCGIHQVRTSSFLLANETQNFGGIDCSTLQLWNIVHLFNNIFFITLVLSFLHLSLQEICFIWVLFNTLGQIEYGLNYFHFFLKTTFIKHSNNEIWASFLFFVLDFFVSLNPNYWVEPGEFVKTFCAYFGGVIWFLNYEFGCPYAKGIYN